MAKKQISPRLKFQTMMEVLSWEKSHGQVAKPYEIHPRAGTIRPDSIGVWKKQFLEQGSEVFARYDTGQQ